MPLAPLGAVTLLCRLGALGSPLPRSSLFLRMECTRPLEETHHPECLHTRPLEETHHPECLHTRHTQGPLRQASPCRLLDSSPQEPTLGSRQ